MKIALISIAAVSILYLAAKLVLPEQRQNAPHVQARVAEQNAAAPSPISESKPESTLTEPPSATAQTIPNTASTPSETKEQYFARRIAELQQSTGKVREQDRILEISLINAEMALYEKSKTQAPQTHLTPEEQAAIDAFRLQRKSDPAAARDSLLAALNEDSSPAMYYVGANCFAESGDIDTAIDFYMTALDLDDPLPASLTHKANRNLGIMLVKNGDHERSRHYLRTALYLADEPDTTTHGLLGLSELNSGNLPASEYHYKQAITLAPDILDWQVGLAKNLLDQEKYAEAIEHMNAMKANPALGYGKPKG